MSPLNSVVVVSSSRAPSLISSRPADVERMLVDRLLAVPRREGRGERADVGEAQVVEQAHLADALRHLFLEGLAVDLDRVERDVLLGCDRRHQPASLGIVRLVPRLTRSGSSIPFASAIARQLVGSR